MVKKKVLVFLHSKMVIRMKEIFGMVKKMEKVLFYIQVGIFIKGSGKMIKDLELEH